MKELHVVCIGLGQWRALGTLLAGGVPVAGGSLHSTTVQLPFEMFDKQSGVLPLNDAVNFANAESVAVAGGAPPLMTSWTRMPTIKAALATVPNRLDHSW
jgi:hypothetical protein